MNPLSCVTFDVDDTLYLERDYVRSGFIAVGAALRQAGHDCGFAETAWQLFCDGARGHTFDETLELLGLPSTPKLITELRDVYRAHEPAITLLPDAAAVIDALRGRVTLAAITDGPAISQQAKVTALGLDDVLDPLVITEHLGAGLGKPDPMAFTIVATAHRFTPDQLVYVADNPAKDFIAPHQLGWRTIRVRRPGSLHADVDSGDDVDDEIPDLRALLDVLDLP
jgi:putative hydrolase of the HAD superfamily